MRVLHWYPNLFGGDGVANAVMGLAKAQTQLGAEVIIAAVQPRSEPSKVDRPLRATGARVVLWKPKWHLMAGNVGIRRLSRRDRDRLTALRPDIVHIHGEFNPDNLRVPSLFPCPKILSPHGAFHPVVRARNRIAKAAYITLAKRALYRRVAFHALSPMERTHILAVCPRGRVVVCPNGPSPRMEGFFDVSAEPADGSAPFVSFFFAGRLDVYAKGLDIMLDAFAAVCRELPGESLVLRLAGADYAGGKAELKAQARELGIEDRVQFLGFLEDAALARAYAAADIYLQISRYEAFSLSVVDALLFGKVVILGTGAGNGSYPEISSLPHVALVAPDAQPAARAMLHAVRNIGLLGRAGMESRAAIRTFLSWNAVAERTLEAYRDLP